MSNQEVEQLQCEVGVDRAAEHTEQATVDEAPPSYTARPHAEVTKENWTDCLYCAGTPSLGFCPFNHVEAARYGDAKKKKKREEFETVVECPLPVLSCADTQTSQRFTSLSLYVSKERLRYGI